MNLQFHVILTIIGMVLCFWLFLFSLYKSITNKSFYLSLLSLVVFFCEYGKLVYYSGVLEASLSGLKIYIIFIFYIPLLFYFFLKEYQNIEISRKIDIIMFIPPIIMTIWATKNLTMDNLGIYFYSVTDEYGTIVHLTKGNLYEYMSILLLVITIILEIYMFYTVFKVKKENIPQNIFLLLSISATFLGVLQDYSTDTRVEYSAIGFIIVSITFFIILLKFNTFNQIEEHRITAISNLNECFIIVNNKGIIQDYNQKATEIFPFINSQKRYINIRQIYDLDWHKILNNSYYEFKIIQEDNIVNYYRSSIYPILNEKGNKTGSTILIYNTSEIMSMINNLKRYSITDYSTKLYNRNYLNERIKSAIPIIFINNKSFAIVLFDLDNFKFINDSYGHSFGDYIIKCFSEILIENTRDTDIVCRYGGEEFVVFFPYLDGGKALKICERIREDLEKKDFYFENKLIKVTVSGGLSNFDRSNYITIANAINKSDEMLYEAKINGKNQIKISNIP